MRKSVFSILRTLVGPYSKPLLSNNTCASLHLIGIWLGKWCKIQRLYPHTHYRYIDSHSRSIFTFTKMRVQFRIDIFVNVETRSLLGSIHLYIDSRFSFQSGMSRIRWGNKRFQFVLRNNYCAIGHSFSRKLLWLVKMKMVTNVLV